MNIKTHGGRFVIEEWMAHPGNPREVVQMRLRFKSNAPIEAKSIGFIQVVRLLIKDAPYVSGPVTLERAIPVADQHGGAHVDCTDDDCNPVYGVTLKRGAAHATSLTQGQMNPDFGVLGRHAYGGGDDTVDAILRDDPKVKLDKGDCSMLVETAALVLAGADEGYYLGAIRWGWSRTGQTIHLNEPALLANASPYDTSPMFKRAAERWNEAGPKTGGLPLPFKTQA